MLFHTQSVINLVPFLDAHYACVSLCVAFPTLFADHVSTVAALHCKRSAAYRLEHQPTAGTLLVLAFSRRFL